ncbi:hypothetical protein BK120_27165 [Paenibacillus sp. FSL A5-0031]|uniref:hypothetical protein n=1 Tax=Paenibacillus sp. FSL A5-0031 TaxID=1920420 RepID=UPI00096BECA4|nr:hypothetical protein [Paenibacillus sp. FSL A5-0031]OME77208.1 hypothetical protein BK120_27165 [Paenibacillus sp. FSL A5-0031]
MDIAKKNKIIYVLIAVILIAMIVTYFSNSSNKLYGNDKESIQEVIKSIEGYEDESVEILEIKDIDDARIVGFLSNNNPAYIQFSKNQKGNYKWRNIEKQAGQSFTTFLIHKSKNESRNLKFMIVTNQENNIAKMELEVNKQVIEQEFSVNQKSVTWIDIDKDNTLVFKYKYYDKDGNLLSDN